MRNSSKRRGSLAEALVGFEREAHADDVSVNPSANKIMVRSLFKKIVGPIGVFESGDSH